ncbi:MAG: hypothetical protein NWS99_03990 [Paracoccaceae bacterium]|nr:hypothetical protein [Paracoccaceae bacterium]MDP5345273.1 hypothetical protein [Paracoccaceae bacterium]
MREAVRRAQPLVWREPYRWTGGIGKASWPTIPQITGLFFPVQNRAAMGHMGAKRL